MASLRLSLACISLLVVCGEGCFFLDIGCKVKEMISKAENELIGKAEQAFDQAMDHLFDQDIAPLIDKAEAAIDAGIDKVDQDVNQTINHIETSIESIIQQAAQTANALASNVTHDIEQIIQEAASALEQVENTLYRDASNLLAKINQIVQKGQCMEAGGAKQIQDAIYKLLKSLNPFYRLSSCWRQMGFKLSQSFEDLTEVQLYDYQKQCTLLNKITPTTPIRGPGGLLEVYAQGQLYAAEYYCVGETAGAPAFQDLFSKEWLWWGVQYNSWKSTASNHIASPNHIVAIKAPVLADPCNTPVECYAQAIKKLNEAEQMISGLQTDISGLKQTTNKNTAAISASAGQISSNTNAISTSQQAISDNKDAISTNQQAISSNNDAISTNSGQISSLNVYPCNCRDVTGEGSLCDDANMVSQGFKYYCKDSSCSNAWSPVLDDGSKDGVGIRCCELCMGNSDAATRHALSNTLSYQSVEHCDASGNIVPMEA